MIYYAFFLPCVHRGQNPSNTPLSDSGAALHSLRKNAPVVTLHGSSSVDGGHRDSKPWRIIWVKGNVKETVFDVNNCQFPILWEHRWGRHPWLDATHVSNDIFDFPQIVEKTPPVTSTLPDDKNRRVPGAVGSIL